MRRRPPHSGIEREREPPHSGIYMYIASQGEREIEREREGTDITPNLISPGYIYTYIHT